MFKRFTKNPKRETNDCGIRSFANAENKDWETVAKEIFDIALSEYTMPNDASVFTKYAEKYGYEENYIFPDNPFNIERFAQTHPQGRYVALVGDDEGGHAVSIIDGDWYDLVDSAKHEIMSYWVIK